MFILTERLRKLNARSRKTPINGLQATGFIERENIMTQTAEIINFERPVVEAKKGDGFAPIAIRLAQSFASNKLSPNQNRVVWAIITKTYGWGKSFDWVCNQQISDITATDGEERRIPKNKVSEARTELVRRKILIVKGREIGINPVVSEWLDRSECPENGTGNKSRNQDRRIPKSGQHSPENRTKQSLKREPQKKETTTKETNTKESRYAFAGNKIKINHKDFETFKKTYPNLNLVEELAQLDIELAEEKKWWSVLHAKLNYRNKAAKSNQSSKPARRARPENFSSKDYGNDLVRF